MRIYRNENGWIREFESRGALWIHDGNPKRPHALLTSGLHSAGFFNSRLVIADEPLLREAVNDLIELFIKHGRSLEDIELTVGPQTGATRLAELLSQKIMRDCIWLSPRISEREGNKSIFFSYEEARHLPLNPALLCDDVLTTGESVELVDNAVINGGGTTLPFVLVLVNRSGLKEVNGKKVLALIDKHMPIWKPEECQLCKEGSKAIRPKDNWAKLTGKQEDL